MSETIKKPRKPRAKKVKPVDTAAESIAEMKEMLDLVRKEMPTLIANDVIGTSPMVGPIGLISQLRARYDDSFEVIKTSAVELHRSLRRAIESGSKDSPRVATANPVDTIQFLGMNVLYDDKVPPGCVDIVPTFGGKKVRLKFYE